MKNTTPPACLVKNGKLIHFVHHRSTLAHTALRHLYQTHLHASTMRGQCCPSSAPLLPCCRLSIPTAALWSEISLKC